MPTGSPDAMSHIKHIKEMLSIQPGNRTDRNMATSGYSSFTDSQLFFGTQFWPENSQGLSQDMSVSSRNSQQSSQEGSDPKFSSNYHAKPLLFGDKIKAFGVLDKFEDDKAKAKEKADSDNLSKEFNHIREALSKLVSGTDKNSAVCQTVFEKFDQFASTMENNLISLQSDISQQFQTLLQNVNSQKKITTDLEERVKKEGEHKAELDSNLQILRTSLRCVSEEQVKERDMLHDALKLLNTLVSEHTAKPSPERVVDRANQTSPVLHQQTSNILQDDTFKATPLTCISNNLEHHQTNVLLQNHNRTIRKRKFTISGHRRHKKRPLVPSQRSKHPVTDENSQPLIHCDKNQNVLREQHNLNTDHSTQDSLTVSPLKPQKRRKRSRAAGCAITPLSCWSQDSSSSQCPAGDEHILDKHTAESRTDTPVKKDGFWQLFDVDSES